MTQILDAYHTALYIQKILITLSQPPYNPDLVPPGFLLFSKIKTALNGARFEGIEAIQISVNEASRRLLGCAPCVEISDKSGWMPKGKNFNFCKNIFDKFVNERNCITFRRNLVYNQSVTNFEYLGKKGKSKLLKYL